MLGVELVKDRRTKEHFDEHTDIDSRVREKFKKHGLLLGSNNGIISIGPPLVITRGQVDEIVHAIDLALWEIEGDLGIASSV